MKQPFLFFWPLLAACFFCTLPKAHAAKLPDFRQIGALTTGKSATIVPTGQAAKFDTRIPVNPVNNGASGWTTAGNYGVAPSATGTTMNMSASGEVFLSGTKYPFQAAYQMPRADIAAAIGQVAFAVVGGIPGMAVAGAIAAMPFAYKWITDSGGRVNPETGQLERSDPEICTTAPCYEYKAGSTPWLPSARAACDVWATFFESSSIHREITSLTADNCFYKDTAKADGQVYGPFIGTVYERRSAPPSSATWHPSSMDDIAPYMANKSPDARVLDEILRRGGELPLGTPSVTGPSSIQGAEKTTQNPDGSRTVEKTVFNFTTEGNKITNTSNTTTQTTYNADNSVRNVSITTQVKSDEENSTPNDTSLPAQPKLYEPEYPDGLTGVWRDRKAELQSSPLLNLVDGLMPSVGSSGSCPSFQIPLDVGIANFGTGDVSPPCWIWDFAKIVVIAGALILARALVFGG